MKLYAMKNGGSFRISNDQIKKYVADGYEIVDEHYRTVKDPLRYAKDSPETVVIASREDKNDKRA